MGIANPGLVLTVFTIQHFAAHGLFDLLVATQPHPIHPGTGMVLLQEVLVGAHHCPQIRNTETYIYIDPTFSFACSPRTSRDTHTRHIVRFTRMH